ncbi:hypothetical protein GCM10011577_38650 [Pseudarthrobacter polychromogenes]|uniref:Uncharacterized protein n=1 Tax=Pseudarthrobacter polychromogenes TaxID=1676 RepID=A0ABQ1Y1U4_9MICC|nr:hypothetical protein GCM10011577_38650 [Pseudarthrobacter polychromogenes]
MRDGHPKRITRSPEGRKDIELAGLQSMHSEGSSDALVQERGSAANAPDHPHGGDIYIWALFSPLSQQSIHRVPHEDSYRINRMFISPTLAILT